MLNYWHNDVFKWKHFPRLLALCVGISTVTGEFPAQKPVTRSFDVFLDLRLDKQLSKQSWGWFETSSRSLWRHCNDHEWIQSIWMQSTHTRTYASDTNYSCSWRLTHMCGSEQVHLCFLKWLLFCKVISHYLNQYWHVVNRALQWRHNGHDGVSNHQPYDCLLNRLFRRRSKKTSKLCVTGLCGGEFTDDRWIDFPAQRASNADFFSFDDVIMLGDKPLPEPILTWCQSGHLKQRSVKFESEHDVLLSWSTFVKCRLQDISHFPQASVWTLTFHSLAVWPPDIDLSIPKMTRTRLHACQSQSGVSLSLHWGSKIKIYLWPQKQLDVEEYRL